MPWLDVVYHHLKAAQQRAEGRAAEAFQLYIAAGQHSLGLGAWVVGAWLA